MKKIKKILETQISLTRLKSNNNFVLEKDLISNKTFKDSSTLTKLSANRVNLSNSLTSEHLKFPLRIKHSNSFKDEDLLNISNDLSKVFIHFKNFVFNANNKNLLNSLDSNNNSKSLLAFRNRNILFLKMLKLQKNSSSNAVIL